MHAVWKLILLTCEMTLAETLFPSPALTRHLSLLCVWRLSRTYFPSCSISAFASMALAPPFRCALWQLRVQDWNVRAALYPLPHAPLSSGLLKLATPPSTRSLFPATLSCQFRKVCPAAPTDARLDMFSNGSTHPGARLIHPFRLVDVD